MQTLLSTLVVFVALFAVTIGYNFDDAVYNQILANNFDDFAPDAQNFISNHRFRRDAEHKCHGRHSSCCNEDVFQKMHENGKETFKECFKTVTGKEFGEGPPKDPFSCENMEKRKKEIICIISCLGKKKGLVDDDGNVKPDDAKQFLKEKFADIEWIQSHIDEYVDKCATEAKEEAGKFDASDKDACNPSGLKFKHCLWKSVQLGCPADQITDENKCKKIREYIDKHGDVFPPPPLPHIH